MLDKDTKHWNSRKYRSAWFLTIIFLALLVVPAAVTLFLNLFVASIVFSILPVEAFVTFITLIWAAYFGANVTQSHKSFTHKTVSMSDFKEDTGSGSGGQPQDSIGKEP